ncbi:MAG: DUF2332 family protein [Rhodobacter sp.]|nr:DUF2332 family protein [Rhodobacter sp.]
MNGSVRASFRDQAEHCAALGSELTARCGCWPMIRAKARCRPRSDWPGDPSPRADALALRLAGGLHALVLSGDDPGLAAAYRAGTEAVLRPALALALRQHATHLSHWLDSPPQTNEVRRSAVLIAAGHWLARRFGLPMVLSELGRAPG